MKRSSNIISLLLVSSLVFSCAGTPVQPVFEDPIYADGMRSVLSMTASTPKLQPWSGQKFSPVVGERATKRRAPKISVTAAGPIQATGYLAFKFYQHTFSVVDGQTCRFSPTCSRFGLDATAQHGLLGLAMAFGRLHRNHLDDDFYRKSGFTLKDPVKNYTFYFADAVLDGFALFKDPDHAWYMHVHAIEDLEHPVR